jgi:arginase family enzyme
VSTAPDATRDRRAAVVHVAGRVGDPDDRAMRASPLLAAALADRLGTGVTRLGTAGPATDRGWRIELEAARPLLTRVAAEHERLLAAGRVPVTALGRCAAALATLPVLARHRPDAVVVWCDGHADLNTPGTTTTGFLGGLALAGPLGLWASGLGAGLVPGSVVLVGARDLDPAERRLVADGVVDLVPPGPDLPALLAAVLGDRPRWLHVDCDVLEPGDVPTGYHVPGGLALADLAAAAAVVAAGEVVGVQVAELVADGAEAVTAAGVARLVAALGPVLDAVGA